MLMECFILGADTTADTYSLWWDSGSSGTYTLIRENIQLNLEGETDFARVNGLTFDPGGGVLFVERIVVDTDLRIPTLTW